MVRTQELELSSSFGSDNAGIVIPLTVVLHGVGMWPLLEGVLFLQRRWQQGVLLKGTLCSYAMWTTMPNVYKNEVYKNTVQEKSKKNKENRKKQNIPHTGGSKSIARKRAEMEIEKGAPVSRGDVWTATHKRRDGSFVNDEARLISVPNEGSGQFSPEVASRSTPSLNND
ncbi:putative transposase [Senna tora]|uniref:Putative transposase n=1 Tax=Senna tora TaxID=362788 RepID=A0A834WYR1_9FABA|nr:putative transposase [Senna tora]